MSTEIDVLNPTYVLGIEFVSTWAINGIPQPDDIDAGAGDALAGTKDWNFTHARLPAVIPDLVNGETALDDGTDVITVSIVISLTKARIPLLLHYEIVQTDLTTFVEDSRTPGTVQFGQADAGWSSTAIVLSPVPGKFTELRHMYYTLPWL